MTANETKEVIESLERIAKDCTTLADRLKAGLQALPAPADPAKPDHWKTDEELGKG